MSHPFDESKAEAFSARMVGTLNEAFLALMVSIGNQTRLFDTLDELPPSQSGTIARAAGLHERYVREWLGAMVTGGIVDYDADTGCYALPPEHAASLTTAAGTGNLSTQLLWVACMGEVEQKVVEAFRDGGGVPYSFYDRFHSIMKSVSAQVFDGTLLERTLPLVPGVTKQLEEGADVLDVGCGSGHAVNVMARAFPRSRFTGYDLSESGIAEARREARQWDLENVHFDVRDVAKLGESRRYDFITAFDSIHDQAAPRAVLAHVARALRGDGTFLMVDIRASSLLEENLGLPLAPFLYSISTMHCMTVSLALDGEGLGTVWGEQKARELLGEAGFQHVQVHEVPGDLLNSYYVSRLA